MHTYIQWRRPYNTHNSHQFYINEKLNFSCDIVCMSNHILLTCISFHSSHCNIFCWLSLVIETSNYTHNQKLCMSREKKLFHSITAWKLKITNCIFPQIMNQWKCRSNLNNILYITTTTTTTVVVCAAFVWEMKWERKYNCVDYKSLYWNVFLMTC